MDKDHSILNEIPFKSIYNSLEYYRKYREIQAVPLQQKGNKDFILVTTNLYTCNTFTYFSLWKCNRHQKIRHLMVSKTIYSLYNTL